VRVEEGERGERLRRDEVMIDHHRVDPARARQGEALVIARATVAGDEQGRGGGEHARERLLRQAVAALQAGREQRDDRAAKAPEDAGHDRG
jgi:hypothetical protein